MLLVKYALIVLGSAALVLAAAILAADLYRAGAWRMALADGVRPRWRAAWRLGIGGVVAVVAGLSIVVVPAGLAGVRVSQISGTLPGTLYPGVHAVVPFVHDVELYNLRDAVFTTAAVEDPKTKLEPTLRVQSKEGLIVGLAVAVRYRLDPRRLHLIHSSLPQPIEEEVVLPVVASAFREQVPGLTVRQLFSTRREEMRARAAEVITARLASDGIVVREVLLRDLVLPGEYARGLEGLLLKEQENERMGVELEVKQKLVRTAELEAEAEKARQVKRAEAQAQVTVLGAKAQADAMQHTLPLKEKQIQQTRLESEARKEATVKNAEAAAQAKVIDSRAELEKRKLLAEADDHRIRLIAAADAERMKAEAVVLRQNPLLIQKIIAERLSDKVQIMMVPTDGKFFFANDVLRSVAGAPQVVLPQEPDR